jgi:hypothetical protein
LFFRPYWNDYCDRITRRSSHVMLIFDLGDNKWGETWNTPRFANSHHHLLSLPPVSHDCFTLLLVLSFTDWIWLIFFLSWIYFYPWSNFPFCFLFVCFFFLISGASRTKIGFLLFAGIRTCTACLRSPCRP